MLEYRIAENGLVCGNERVTKRWACIQQTLCCAKDSLLIVVLVVVTATAAAIPPKLQHGTVPCIAKQSIAVHTHAKNEATASSTLINKRSGKSGIRSVLFSFRYRCFNSSHVKCFSFVKHNRQKKTNQQQQQLYSNTIQPASHKVFSVLLLKQEHWIITLFLLLLCVFFNKCLVIFFDLCLHQINSFEEINLCWIFFGNRERFKNF